MSMAAMRVMTRWLTMKVDVGAVIPMPMRVAVTVGVMLAADMTTAQVKPEGQAVSAMAMTGMIAALSPSPSITSDARGDHVTPQGTPLGGGDCPDDARR